MEGRGKGKGKETYPPQKKNLAPPLLTVFAECLAVRLVCEDQR